MAATDHFHFQRWDPVWLEILLLPSLSAPPDVLSSLSLNTSQEEATEVIYTDFSTSYLFLPHMIAFLYLFGFVDGGPYYTVPSYLKLS